MQSRPRSSKSAPPSTLKQFPFCLIYESTLTKITLRLIYGIRLEEAVERSPGEAKRTPG
jgi:hypothetical protein